MVVDMCLSYLIDAGKKNLVKHVNATVSTGSA